MTLANYRKQYEYKNQLYDIYQLSEMSGYSVTQLRQRMQKGYSIEQAMRDNPMHDSVIAFDKASHWQDWIGKPTTELYQIYWEWCIRNNLTPVTQRQLSQELLPKYNLHTVSMATNDGKARRYVRKKQMRDLYSGRII